MADQNTAPAAPQAVPQTVTLSVQLVNAILGYMGNQPYVQVRQLIEAVEKEAAGQFSAEPSAPAEAPAEGN
jgi:hypothetical protein